MLSNDHQQPTDPEKEADYCESSDVDIGEDINKVIVTMHGVTYTDVLDNAKLGPVLTSTVKVEREPVEALLDNGSPVTIISLQWILQMLAKQC